MALYIGIDLHSRSCYIAGIDEERKRVLEKKIVNDIDLILKFLQPYKEKIASIAVESTYNWYWLVDGLQGAGYKVKLANPSAMHKYKGIKHINDRHDAFWLAEMLGLGILPEGYIYPKEERSTRDLLRKRLKLVQLRTGMINSLKGIMAREGYKRIGANKIKALKKDYIESWLPEDEGIEIQIKICKEYIDSLTEKIKLIEKKVKERVKLRPEFEKLLTVPGIGEILAMTIMLEVGDIRRFKKVGDFASYSRKVESKWKSEEKLKGKGNKKNGNKYLAWAFSEAAELARRFDEKCKKFYQGKLAKTNKPVAHSALSHKISRATYFVLRDNVEFDYEKLFGQKTGIVSQRTGLVKLKS